MKCPCCKSDLEVVDYKDNGAERRMLICSSDFCTKEIELAESIFKVRWPDGSEEWCFADELEGDQVAEYENLVEILEE
jgi:hypothetical protein